MRSIGKYNIRKLEKITTEEIEKRRMPWGIIESYAGLDEAIIDRLPVEWWDIWESADSEIRRLIKDFIFNYKFSK
jgi:hypothetical protein